MTLHEQILAVYKILQDAKVPELDRVVAFPCDEYGEIPPEFTDYLVQQTAANYREVSG